MIVVLWGIADVVGPLRVGYGRLQESAFGQEQTFATAQREANHL
jgi:hypothetical protein